MNSALSTGRHTFSILLKAHPHEIRPRFASVLRFQVGTDVIFTKLVNHPGTKPSDLLEQVKKSTEQEIPRFFEEAWDEVTDFEGY